MRLLQYYPSWYRDWLFEALPMAAGDEVEPAVIDALCEFNRRWVKAPETALPDYLETPSLLRAYGAFYMTINMPKLWLMLDQCRPVLDWLYSAPAPIRIAEIGCGPGTFLWATLFYLMQHRPADLERVAGCLGIDRTGPALQLAERLAQSYRARQPSPEIEIAFRQADWRDAAALDSDVLIFGNVLNESNEDVRARLIRSTARVLIIIEPGTRSSFRRVRPLRDALSAAGWRIAFPCAAAGSCPMPEDNWCHFRINRFVLPFIQRMAGAAGRLNPHHHFSGFVFCRDGPSPAPGCWRVLSALRKAHRSGIRYLCDGRKVVETVLNRRARTPATRPFLEAEIGDLLHIETPDGGGALRGHGRLGPRDCIARCTERDAWPPNPNPPAH